jgi:hypothetical protein
MAGNIMNQDILIGQPIAKVVRSIGADDSAKPKPSNQDLSEITRKRSCEFPQGTLASA